MAQERNQTTSQPVKADDLVIQPLMPRRHHRRPRPAARRQRRTAGSHRTADKTSLGRCAAVPQSAAILPGGETAWSDLPVSISPARPRITYTQWFREHVLRSRWLMWFVTIYLHLLLLLVLAAICIHHPDMTGDFVLTMTLSSDAEPLDPSPLETEVFEIEPPQETETPPEPSPRPDLAALLPEREEVNNLLASVVQRLRESAAAKPSSASAESAAKPSPASTPKPPNPAPWYAVTAGSFSVWTEPANPAPDEPYRIVVQIKMPDGTTRYNLRDLDGVVIGSDGYRKPIPGFQRSILPVTNGYVRYEIPVVSGDAMVEDIVFVRSRMLREAQRLRIQF
jgi:hypothetical protein